MYSRIHLAFLFTILSNFITNAQVIKVFDKETKKGITSVLVYSQSNPKAYNTDKNGSVDISIFSENDVISFQHQSYLLFSIRKDSILSLQGKIELSAKTLNFEEVVISANKWEQDSKEIANKIVSISPKNISFQNPQTAADMLAATGQIFVQKSQLGGGSPMLRGFAANRILIMVDGVRMNNAIFRNGNLQNVISIDPNTLEGAEVIFGPGSVIYGSDALGGVMDFHSKRLEYSPSSKPAFETNVLLRTSSSNFEKTAHADFSVRGRKLSSYTSLSFSDFDNLRSGKKHHKNHPDFGKRQEYVIRRDDKDIVIQNPKPEEQIFSGYSQLNVMQKLRWRLSDNIDVIYSVQHATTSNIPRYDRLIEREAGQLAFAEWQYGPQKWTNHILQSTLYKKTKLFNQGRISLNFQDVQESRIDRAFNNNSRRTRTEKVKVYALNMDFDKIVNSKAHIYYGLEAFENTIESTANRTDISDGTVSETTPRYPDDGSNYKSFATYLSYKNNLSNKSTLTIGTRFSAIWLNAQLKNGTDLNFPFNEFDLKNSAVNGSIGFTHRPSASWQLNFLTSSGFRSPNIDDVGKVFEGTNSNLVVPNFGLKPEFSYNIETGIKKVINNKVQLEATGFISFLRDAIVRRDFIFNGMDSILFDGNKLKVQAFVNTGSAKIYGASLKARVPISNRFVFSTTFTTISGTDQDNFPLRHVTPIFGETKFTYENNQLKVELFSIYNRAIKFDNLAPSEKDKAYLYTSEGALSWYTLNVRSSYTFNRRIRLTAALENILDKHYRPYSSGISAPGINFVLAGHLSF